MKKVILTLIALAFSIATFAQENNVRTPSGYQGFLEQTTLYRLADDMRTTVGISTTHGFYFGGNTFVGIGMGFEGGDEFFAVPIYTAIKYNFGYTKNVTPTVQVRVGSCLSENTGAYGDLALGVRFGSSRDFAVNVMVTGTLYERQERNHSSYYPTTDTYKTVIDKANVSGVGLRIGIEW